MPPLSAPSPAASSPPHRRRGNPNGNPCLNLSPRCGARTRAGCPCRAPAVHGGLRCRMHGGRSTGPRTEEGLARARAARTRHGQYGAAARTGHRHGVSALRRARVLAAAARYLPLLPPDLAARLWQFPPELQPLALPVRLLTVAEDRALRLAEAAALAPWRAAIAEAREVRRAEWRQRMGRGGSGAALLAGVGIGAHVFLEEAPDTPVLAGVGRRGPVIPGEAPDAPVLLDGPLALPDPLRGSSPHKGGGDAQVAPAVRARAEAMISAEAPLAPVLAGAGMGGSVISGEAPYAPVMLKGPLSLLDPLRGSSPREGGRDARVAPPVRARAEAVISAKAPLAPDSGELDHGATPAVPPPGLTRKERRHWKWLQRQARRQATEGPVT